MISSARRSPNRCEERRDLGRVVLAIGVERHDRGRSRIERVAEPGPQRRALAGIRLLAQDHRSGRTGAFRGIVGRTVVDDHDRQVPASGLDDRADARALLVGRDQREDGPLRARHGPSIAAGAILMTNSGTATTLHEIDASDRGASTGEPAMTLTPPDPEPTPTAPTAGDEVAFSTRTPGPSRLRVAAVAGAAVALAVGVVATSLAATPAPSAGTTNNSTTGVAPAPVPASIRPLDEEAGARSPAPRWQGLPRHHDQGDQRLERHARDR